MPFCSGRTGDKVVTYEQFLVGIRGELNSKRKAVALRAYDKLDATRDGSLRLIFGVLLVI